MPRSRWFGIALVVISTIAIAIVPTFAKLAYDGGANTLSVITARSILSIVIMTAILPLAKTSLRIRPRPMLIGLAMGVVYAALLYGYIGAVQFLPVNRVVLIVFIHPLLVNFIVMYRGKEGITATAVTASVVALIGLVLAIGLSADSLDPRGIGLAAVAMVTAVIYILGNASAVREASSLAVVFYVMLAAGATLSILFALFGQTALPTTALSWIGFVGVAFGATIGTITFISGMAHIGAARAAMISNVEPVLGVLFPVAVLGERVTLVQAGGIIMVFAAIATMEFSRRGA